MKPLLILCALVCLASWGTAISQTTESLNTVAAMSDIGKLRSIAQVHRGEKIGASAQNRIGMIFYSQKNNDAAEREFLITYTQHTDQRAEAMQAAYYLGKISLNKEDPKQAMKYFSESLSSGSLVGADIDWARYYQVKAMYRSEDPSYLTTVRSYLTGSHDYSKRNDISVRYDLVRYLANKHQYGQALEEANTIVNLFPNDPLSMNVRFEVGELYFMLGRPQDALNQFSAILNTAGQDPVVGAHALYQIGVAYDNEGDLVNARSTYRKVIDAYPTQTRWVNASEFGIAMIEYREVKPGSSLDAAYEALHSFVSNHPTDHHVPQALMTLASLNMQRGKYSEAVSEYDQVIQFDPSLIPIKSKASLRSNDVNAFRDLVLRAHFAKASLLRTQLVKPDLALAEYNLILESHPESEEALFCKALSLIQLDRRDEARGILNNLSSSGTDYGKMAQQTLKTL
ncbi:MAG TPA: tetratricopeptide repeat protein [Candidatus Acidoferrales bacterium]|nr:tetratricopeptide repeat protein [Candidatus Acidoferrales bacterium]